MKQQQRKKNRISDRKMKRALWREIEDKISSKIVNREQKYKNNSLTYSWEDIQEAIKLTINIMKRRSRK